MQNVYEEKRIKMSEEEMAEFRIKLASTISNAIIETSKMKGDEIAITDEQRKIIVHKIRTYDFEELFPGLDDWNITLEFLVEDIIHFEVSLGELYRQRLQIHKKNVEEFRNSEKCQIATELIEKDLSKIVFQHPSVFNVAYRAPDGLCPIEQDNERFISKKYDRSEIHFIDGKLYLYKKQKEINRQSKLEH